MVGLEDAILVRPKLLKLRLKKLRFLVCDGLLVEDENVGDVIGVDLTELAISSRRDSQDIPFP